MADCRNSRSVLVIAVKVPPTSVDFTCCASACPRACCQRVKAASRIPMACTISASTLIWPDMASAACPEMPARAWLSRDSI